MQGTDILKMQAAHKAVEFVEDGMVLGLGTGSTTEYAVLRIAELIKNGTLKNIKGIPTSVRTEVIARENGIPMFTFDEYPEIDLTIDGADEVDAELNLIKGGGGALLREKVVAQASGFVIIVVDETKISSHLGKKWAVPIEVLKFAANTERLFLSGMGAEVKFRYDGSKPYITDEGNYIIDANFGTINNPEELAGLLEKRAGIVENGLFCGIAGQVICASPEGIRIIKK